MVLISIVSSYLRSNKFHSVHPSSLSAGGGLSLLLNFQKGGAWQDLSPQISESQRTVPGKDRGDIFQGVCRHKCLWQKSLKTKMFLPLITKNLNWEILTKNLVRFKRWDWVKDWKF